MDYKPEYAFQRIDFLNRPGQEIKGVYYLNQNLTQPSETKSKQYTSFSHVSQLQSPINNSLDIKQQNEKLQIKVRYLEDFIDNMTIFEKTQSIIDLKGFLNKNYRRFSMLLDEIYELREKNEQSQNNMYSIPHESEITQLKATILSYQSKLDEYERLILIKDQEINQFKSIPRAQISEYNTLTKEQVQEQVQNLENTIKALSNEVNELTLKNQKYREQLSKKDFFHEYDCMCKEVDLFLKNFQVEGLRKQNQKLVDQLKGKEQQSQKQLNENKFSFFQ